MWARAQRGDKARMPTQDEKKSGGDYLTKREELKRAEEARSREVHDWLHTEV